MSDAFCEEGFCCVGGVGAGEELVGDVLFGGWWCCWSCHGGDFMDFELRYLVMDDMEEFALYFVGFVLVCTVAWRGLRWSGSWRTAKNVLISLSLSGSPSTPSSQAYRPHTDHSKT